MSWSLVVPFKPLSLAKSRLAGAIDSRPAMALAFALDTVTAALASPEVAAVTVVTGDATLRAALARLGAHVTDDVPDAGLNAALLHGEGLARRWSPESVAAMNGDLPALRPAELTLALREAARRPGRSFVPDAAGTGTTLLAAAHGAALRPGFGTGSRARHLASGAHELRLDGIASLRQDVDTGDDLRVAGGLGLGAHTRGALAGSRAPMQPAPGV